MSAIAFCPDCGKRIYCSSISEHRYYHCPKGLFRLRAVKMRDQLGFDRRKNLGEVRKQICEICGREIIAHSTTIAMVWSNHRKMHVRRGKIKERIAGSLIKGVVNSAW